MGERWQALAFLAGEQGIGRYPTQEEDWAAMLLERHMIDETALAGIPGSSRQVAYHYAPPSEDALMRWRQGGEAPIVIYEDPSLFHDGGNVVRADTTVLWLDQQEHLRVIADLLGE